MSDELPDASAPQPAALHVEQFTTPGPRWANVDLDALVERVYRRLADELRLEHERARWLS